MPTRSPQQRADIEAARRRAEADGYGLRIHYYDCGAVTTEPASNVPRGDTHGWQHPCTSNDLHTHQPEPLQQAPERSRYQKSTIEDARRHAEANGRGLLVTNYSCGGFGSSVHGTEPGALFEENIPCPGHPHPKPQPAEPLRQPAEKERIAAAYILDDVERMIRNALSRPDVRAAAETAAEAITAAFYLIPKEDIDPEAWDTLRTRLDAERAERQQREDRDARRLAIITDLLPEAYAANNPQHWEDLALVTQRAIDRILELQDQQP